jgi:hypothetical protein
MVNIQAKVKLKYLVYNIQMMYGKVIRILFEKTNEAAANCRNEA